MATAVSNPTISTGNTTGVSHRAQNKINIEKTSEFVQNFVAAPVCAYSALSGTLSYLLPNYFDTESELLSSSAMWSAKGAILVNAIFGAYDNGCSKNTPGTLGYLSDFIVSFVADNHNMYTLRGFGSALDQIPGFLEVLESHPEIKKKYNPKNENDYKFNTYPTFLDSAEKTLTGVKIVYSDIASDFRNKYSKSGLFKALISPFSNVSKNLAISSTGILAGVLTSFIPRLNKVGAIVRDVFGLHADIAVYQKGDAKDAQGKTRNSKLAYNSSGVLYTVGTVLDFVYRCTEQTNLNLFAIGADRLGAFLMALGNAMDNRDGRNGNATTIIPSTSAVGDRA